MSRPRRWSYLATRRSGRIRVTLAAAVFGLVAIVVATALTLWQPQIQSAAQALTSGAAYLGILPVAVMFGLFLLIAAIVVYVMPLPRTHSYLVTNPHRIPRVAVYLDYENQLPNTAIQPFLEYVRTFVGGRRTELVLFSDATLSATGKRYRTLVKGGFRSVDVPHKRVIDVDGDDANAKNSVDVELALYAYQQALLSPHPMDIVLVSGDRDYMPLMRRLWVEGHHVHVWAMAIPAAVAELARQLHFEAAPFSSLFSWEAADEKPAGEASKRLRRKARVGSAKGKMSRTGESGPEMGSRSRNSIDAEQTPARGNDRDEDPVGRVNRAQIVAALSYSRQVLERVRRTNGKGTSALKVLGSQIGNNHRDVTEALGFTGQGWTKRWFLLLQALGFFAPDPGGSMPAAGSVDADVAADRLVQFLGELSSRACALAATTAERTVTFASLQAQMAASSARAQEADRASLRQLVASPSPEWSNPLVQLCRAAATVGLLRFERLTHGAVIGVGEC